VQPYPLREGAMYENAIANWYYQNMLFLQQVFYDKVVIYDREEYTWVRIDNFDLPPIWIPRYSNLLITLPGVYTGIHVSPSEFYLDKNLRTITGWTTVHYFQAQGANRLSHLNYAYLCLHLQDWKPSWDVLSGDNLLTIVDLIYQRMSKA